MRDDLPANGPRDIWLKQPTEKLTMTSILIRQRARELRGRTRRKLLGTLAGPLAAGSFYVFAAKWFPAQRLILQPLFAFAFVWSIAGMYFLSRGMRLEKMPEEGGIRSGLESCLSEMERQRDFLGRVLWWSFGPVLLTISTFVAALVMAAKGGILPNGLPFVTLVAIWIRAYFAIRFREQQTLRREIAELMEMKKTQL